MNALKKSRLKLIKKNKFDITGEIKMNPNPIICKVVLYFPNKSDLTSIISFDWEMMNNLK